MLNTLKKGILVGLETTWTLGKVIFPITLLVTILSQTPIMDWLVKLAEPLMSWIGLSGEAALPLVIGNFLNLYAGIGAILSLDLTVKEVFILAVMLSFSHNLLIESTVAAKVGIKMWVVLVVRIGLALFTGVAISLIWNGGSEQAVYGFISSTEQNVSGVWNIIWLGIEKGLVGILQLAAIVIPLMIFIQIMKDLKWLNVFSKWMSPVTRALGMKENTSTTLAAGIAFGLAYGAGVMIQAVKEDGVEKKDLYLAFIFLVACHAVIEDTLIFIPLGIPIWPLLVIRLVVAIILTMLVAWVWKRVDAQKVEHRKEANL
ncbi:nucleoside recognition domain-containing protein [Pseudalkalibacillus decolorationis]|uniref:nucleoside recognition domain-containing protein n=1 Tax=Pseudalkalibacillus decolorationis TaxID=163879 RepID=UPI0021488EDB|nr:nucleoside recognition domain-containing protein [Pseudalkalibacillus decolorationis]